MSKKIFLLIRFAVDLWLATANLTQKVYSCWIFISIFIVKLDFKGMLGWDLNNDLLYWFIKISISIQILIGQWIIIYNL